MRSIRYLDGRKLSQEDAAKVLGVTQPKVSALRHYKLAGFSVERLMNLLTALDQDARHWRGRPRSPRIPACSPSGIDRQDVPDHFDNRLIQSVATAKVRSMLLCPRPENST